MASIQLDPSQYEDIVRSSYATSVWVKPFWGDKWIWVPYIEPVRATESIAPSMPTAEFVWRYGQIFWEDHVDFDVYTPLDITNWYIAILGHTVYGSFGIWIGVVKVPGEHEIFGLDDDTGLPVGDQVFQAYGMEMLLDRRRIIGGYAEDPEIYIMTTPTFNRRTRFGLSLEGNRSSSKSGLSYLFSGDGEIWSNLDIVEYIMRFFQPPNVTFVLSGQYTMLADIYDEFDLQGLTVRDALDKLISRRRGVGWKIITRFEGYCELFIFSVLPDPISTEEIVVPPNMYQFSVNFDAFQDVFPKITPTALTEHDTLICESAEPVKVAVTVAVNQQVEKGWTESEKTEYIEANDDGRQSEYLSRVFSFFRVKRDFAWDNIYPGVDDRSFVNPGGPYAYWNFEKRFLKFLPIEIETADEDAEPEFRKPFALYHDPATGKYYYSEKLALAKLPNVSLRIADKELGLVLSAQANHVLAKNHWPEDAQSNVKAELDYEKFLFTVFVPTEQKLRVTLPMVEQSRMSETGSTLYFTIPNAEYWAISAGTVIDVDNGGLTIETDWTVKRDDSWRIRAAAAFAQGWYGAQRAKVEFNYAGMLPLAPPGSMIRTAGSGFIWTQVGTVVSERHWDFGRGEISVKTGYAELDPKAFFHA